MTYHALVMKLVPRYSYGSDFTSDFPPTIYFSCLFLFFQKFCLKFDTKFKSLVRIWLIIFPTWNHLIPNIYLWLILTNLCFECQLKLKSDIVKVIGIMGIMGIIIIHLPSWVGIIVLCNGLKILRKLSLILQTCHNRFWNQSSETWYMRLIRWFKDGLTFGKLFFDLAYSYSFLKKTRVSNTKTKKNYNTYCSLNLHPNKFPKN